MSSPIPVHTPLLETGKPPPYMEWGLWKRTLLFRYLKKHPEKVERVFIGGVWGIKPIAEEWELFIKNQ